MTRNPADPQRLGFLRVFRELRVHCFLSDTTFDFQLKSGAQPQFFRLPDCLPDLKSQISNCLPRVAGNRCSRPTQPPFSSWNLSFNP